MKRQASSSAVATAATASSRWPSDSAMSASTSTRSAISAKRASLQAPTADAEPLMVWAASFQALRTRGRAQAAARSSGTWSANNSENFALQGGVAEREAGEIGAIHGNARELVARIAQAIVQR